eukprot:2746510-Prymnesium_polylepis.1
MLVCECEPVPTCHAISPVVEGVNEEVECGAARSAQSAIRASVHDTPAAPLPPPRPLTRPWSRIAAT